MKSKMTHTSVLLVLLVFLAVLTSACGARHSAGTPESKPASGPPPAKVLYLKNNIHVQQQANGDYRASYANWTNPGTGHVIVPVNTQVSVGDFRRGFTLVIQSTKKPIFFEFTPPKGTEMEVEEYKEHILSREPVQLNRLPELDRKGIKEGKAYPGMTKEGVQIALGYPAPSRTQSLENNTWYYWTNRFKAIAIEFDEKGKVKSIGR